MLLAEQFPLWSPYTLMSIIKQKILSVSLRVWIKLSQKYGLDEGQGSWFLVLEFRLRGHASVM